MLVGESGAGKTTRLARLGVGAGVLTLHRPEVRIARRLDTGEERTLAVEKPSDGLRWSFDHDVLDWADEAFREPRAAMVIDEIGPLELLHGKGWRTALASLDDGRHGLAYVALRPSLREISLARWPRAEVRYIKRR